MISQGRGGDQVKVIENIPIKLDSDDLVKGLRIRRNVEYIKDKLDSLIEAITPVMNPKALYSISFVDKIEGDQVTIGDTVFTSKVVRMNLEQVGRVFPYIVTAGSELDDVELSKRQSAMLLDQVKTVVVSKAYQYLRTHLAEKYGIKKLSSVAPGRLDEWPLTQQRELFSLFGDNVDRIGVRLTKTCLMVPVKTVSGSSSHQRPASRAVSCVQERNVWAEGPLTTPSKWRYSA
ncbi:MAG: hypothetical protein ABUK18_00205 [Candidatus Bathyarchaeia archaeon]